MNSTELTITTKEKMEPESIVIIGSVISGAVLIGYGLYLFFKRGSEPTDPPPIVIKTGSFIAESGEGYDPEGNLANPRRKKLNKYNGSFGHIRTINLYIVNSGVQRRYYFEHSAGMILHMWAQGNTSTEPDIKSRLSGQMRFELPVDFRRYNIPNPLRPFEDRIDTIKDEAGNDISFRIRRLQITDPAGRIITSIPPGISGPPADFSIGAGARDGYYMELWDEVYQPRS